MEKRTSPLEMAVLGILHDSPMHGYELRKHLNALLGWGRVFSYGSLYPMLKTLTKSGHIEAIVDSTGMRKRITYQLTAAGKERFADLIEHVGSQSWEDEVFNIRFAFFSRTPSKVRLRVLESRKRRLEELLAHAERGSSKRRADKYATELRRHGLESVEREVKWLSEMIAAEKADLQNKFDKKANKEK